MRKLISVVFLLFAVIGNSFCQELKLPDSIYSGEQGNFHVQGIAIDRTKGFTYFSFTNKLVKTDLSGKLLGSVTGFIGHLGDIDINEKGDIYASLEYKNDAIGKGIKKELGIQNPGEDGFYIAIFDASKITKPDMQADESDLLTTVFIKEAVNDYNAILKTENTEILHRFACSGIDGIAFAPAAGAPVNSKKFLYIAYGIYGDVNRNDNDNQVILKYDTGNWQKYARVLTQGNLHQSGPKKPAGKYFVKTGNTRYGIQNLAYDETSGNLFAAVYKGAKPQYPNYDLFVIDMKKKPGTSSISFGNESIKVQTLALLNAGLRDTSSGINGWHFKWGATGLCPIGNGRFYISHDKKTKAGVQSTTIHQYRWTGEATEPFILVN
ncbi:hypothetical protein [Pedobacter aquatilis]|uniref:hypothetical protein n=1 Tax=Pedobacter aquatilis TaxID=351343 RepID=UPI00292DB6C6|nr:hypothetical protein [Pedobacter aquatilis]